MEPDPYDGNEAIELLLQSAPDFSSTSVLDLSQRPIETAFVFSGFTTFFARVGGELLPGVAKRIEPRGGLSAPSF